ncbi:MAG TPA: glucoamylase family protein [Candidatus Eisenbacteria bacterium]
MRFPGPIAAPRARRRRAGERPTPRDLPLRPPCAALAILLALAALVPRLATAADSPRADAAFLDELERRTFDWFWDHGDPRTGLVPDRWPTRSFSSVAAIGFGLTSYGIGAERGWVTRPQAAERTLATLRFLWQAPQGPEPRGRTGYRGFFYHFLDMDSGLRFEKVELSTIDTGLLMAGVLFSQSYFDRPSPAEAEIRALADSLYRRVDWTFFVTDDRGLTMSWRPEPDRLFSKYHWSGLDESVILHVLALGSPTHAVDPPVWQRYTSGYRWAEFQGQRFFQFAPLFGHQYSQAWLDTRGIADDSTRARGLDYFENSRRAALAQHAYAVANPAGFRDYGEGAWGLTACDGPIDTTLTLAAAGWRLRMYSARGAAAGDVRDDGTLAPTAAAAAIAFAPEEVLPTLRAYRDRYGDHLYTRYGFVDAFNPTLAFPCPVRAGRIVPGLGWFDTDYLGIDQGPIVLMLENHRSGLVWNVMRRNPYVVRGLCRAGFRGGWLEGRCP